MFADDSGAVDGAWINCKRKYSMSFGNAIWWLAPETAMCRICMLYDLVGMIMSEVTRLIIDDNGNQLKAGEGLLRNFRSLIWSLIGYN